MEKMYFVPFQNKVQKSILVSMLVSFLVNFFYVIVKRKIDWLKN